MNIRSLHGRDEDQWRSLWHENMQNQASEALTETTWTRICSPDSPVYGLGAWSGETLTGILHYVLHPTTGSLHHVCYMQDVYVAPAHRRKGIAKAMINELAQVGRQKGWERIYWIVEQNNQEAQNLYEGLGVKLDFSFHVLPLQSLAELLRESD